MDGSRDVIESSKPPKPPRPGRASDPSEPADRPARTGLLTQVIAACAVAAAVFTGITAWETHQDRVNQEVIYCSFYTGSEASSGSDSGSDSGQDAPQRSEAEKRIADQLGCE